MTPARQDESTFLHNPINPDPNFSVGPKVGERPETRKPNTTWVVVIPTVLESRRI